MLSDLTYVVVVVLVPIAPAFLLYKFLPAGKTNVKGPFRGLDVKLSGAFAGYFLVLVLASSLVVFLIQKRPQPLPVYQYEVYTVRGKIDLKSGNQEPLDYKQLSFALEPSQQQVFSDGTFALEIPVKPDQSGQLNFPTLTLEYTDPQNPSQPFEAGTIHLEQNYPYAQDYQVNRDAKAKTIDVKPAIPLARRGYTPTVTPQPFNPDSDAPQKEQP